MKLLTKADVIKGAPDRWAEQYYYCKGEGNDKDLTTRTLLGERPETAERINEIIGNDSWTRLECRQCEAEVNEVIIFEDCDNYTNVCANCLNEAAKLLGSTSDE